MNAYLLDEPVVEDWTKSKKPPGEILRRLDVAYKAGVVMSRNVRRFHTLLGHVALMRAYAGETL